MIIERDAQQSETFRGVAKSSVFRSALLVCAILSMTAGVGVSAETGTTARISDAGDAVELTYPASYGVPNDSIPLYHVGKVRYFSAGIGLEEREATYPAFALKLVFVAEGRSFDPMVEVSITVLTLRSGAAASSRATACETLPSGSERMTVVARAATSALLLAMPAPGGARSVLTASATTSG